MTSAPVKDPILIVGAGPSGLAVALWLRIISPEIQFRIIDHAPGPGTTSRAQSVHARSLEFFRLLGCVGEMLKAGEPLDDLKVMRYGTVKAYVSFKDVGKSLSKYGYVLNLTQDRLEEILVDRLQQLGVQVEWNTTLQTLRQFDDHVSATINGVTERFSYAAGCDGARSSVRRASDISMIGGTYPSRFFVADVTVTRSQIPRSLFLAPSTKTMTVFLPLGTPGHTRLLGSYGSREDGTTPSFEDIREPVRQSTGLEVDRVNWFSTYTVHHRYASSFRQGRLFLLGDAAHNHSPVGGQGLNIAVGDASNFAWKLAYVSMGKAPPELLDTYDVERKGFAKTVINTTDFWFTNMQSQGWVGWFLRNIFFPFLVPWLWCLPFVPLQLFRRISQIIIDYRDSPLSQQHTPQMTAAAAKKETLLAGDRIPYVAFASADASFDNHEPRSHISWQIHVYGSPTDWPDLKPLWHGIPVTHYPLNEDARSKGLRSDRLYILRPDMHIGSVANGFEDSRLAAYIRQWVWRT